MLHSKNEKIKIAIFELSYVYIQSWSDTSTSNVPTIKIFQEASQFNCNFF